MPAALKVKEELRKHMTSLQEGCKASIEAQAGWQIQREESL